MFRILVWFLIFYGIYWLIKNSKKKKREIIINKKSDAEKMIECKNCGIYFPESNGFSKKGKIFCSKKCMEEYFAKKS